LTQYSLRPGVPLQSTLFTMAQSLAQALAREGCRAEDLGRLDIGLTVLTDPAMHGTVANPELEGLDPRSRGTLVIERNKSGIAFNPGATAVELVAEAGRLAEALAPSSAAVFSLDVVSTEASVAVANVPRPETGPAVRPAGVAGKFYPAAAAELAE